MPSPQTPSPLEQSADPRGGRSARWVTRGILASFGLCAAGVGLLLVAPGPESGRGFLELGPGEEVGLLMFFAGIAGVVLCAIWSAVAGVVAAVAPGRRVRLGRAGWAAGGVVAALATTWILIGVLNNTDAGTDLDAMAMPMPAAAATDGEVCTHFSVESEADDFGYTLPLCRTTDRTDVATFAVEQLIAGPSADERAQGYRTPFEGTLRGASTCGGDDFSLDIAGGTARVQFCRTVASGGIGQDARIHATLAHTLGNFPGVQRLVVLDKDGDCFGDESGTNSCLAP